MSRKYSGIMVSIHDTSSCVDLANLQFGGTIIDCPIVPSREKRISPASGFNLRIRSTNVSGDTSQLIVVNDTLDISRINAVQFQSQ